MAVSRAPALEARCISSFSRFSRSMKYAKAVPVSNAETLVTTNSNCVSEPTQTGDAELASAATPTTAVRCA